MLSIYNYLDYRRYLKDFYEAQKAKEISYSYRVFLNKAGISSPSFLKQIIEGDRSLTVKTVEKFLLPLKLNKSESQFFRTLVHFNQAKNDEDRNLHYKSLRDLVKSKKIPVLGEEYYDYYEHWYISALRELVCIYPVKTTDKELGALLFPAVSASKVKFAKKRLIDLKLIEKKGNRYVQTENLISTGSEVQSLVVREFNKQMIKRAQEAIENINPSERNIQGITMGISKSTFNLISEEMNRFQARIMDIIGTDECPDRVYQLNLQMIPLLNPKKLGDL